MRKIFLITLILILFFTCASVAASDVNETVAASEDQGDDVIEIDDENALAVEEQSGDVGATEEDELSASGGTFTDLANDIADACDDFESVQKEIDSAQAGDTIYLHGKTFKGNGKTIMVNKSITLIGGYSDGDNVNATFDGQKQSRIMVIDASDVTLKGITFVNGSATYEGWDPYYKHAGAIYIENNIDNVSVSGCSFINNSAMSSGGAVFVDYKGDFSAQGCVFEGNSANSYGGAMDGGSVVNCVFKDNSANSYGAMDGGSAVNCVFKGNSASSLGGAMGDGSAVNCIFEGNSASDDGGAMYRGSAVNCVFKGNSASREGGAMYYGSAVNCVFEGNSASEWGPAMDSCSADSCIFKTDEDTCFATTFLNPSLTVFNYTSGYKSGDRLKFNLTANNGMEITNRNITVEIFKNNVLVATYNCLSGDGLPISLDLGSYVAVCRSNDYNIDSANATLTIIMSTTNISASSMSATYGEDKYLTITLQDYKGNPVGDANITVDLNGKKTYITDINGQIKVPTKNLVPKIYTAKITFEGNAHYLKSTNEVNITINTLKTQFEASPSQNTNANTQTTTTKKTDNVKLTLKTVKVKKSAKKLVLQATLKINGKAVKGKLVAFKFNGKTYKAKTNKKGIAKVTIKKNVLKKLKVGKKVKYQASYGSTIVKKTVKVKK